MIPFNPLMPWQNDASLLVSVGPFFTPWEYTGWRDEVLAWKESAYLGTSIALGPTYTVKGPEAAKFFNDNFVNDIAAMPVNSMRHGIMCTHTGLIMQDGVVLRFGEDEFYTNWLGPYVQYAFEKGSYNAEGSNITGKIFLFQVAGPRSLEILENVTRTDLHDIKFARLKKSVIAGKDVRILRMGMAGTLAYEVHGKIEDAVEVYTAIWNAGKGLGMKKLGQLAYMLNHTEDGFPQAYYHFPYPWYEDPDFKKWLDQRPGMGLMNENSTLVGSVGKDKASRYINPIEAGWANRINLNHDFPGKAALEKMLKDPRQRRMVTLEWNAEDIMDVYGAQFRDEEPYDYIESRPNDQYYPNFTIATFHYHADKVMKNGKQVGISSGRSISQMYHRMISLCRIDPEFSDIGTEVTVIWGNEGKRQKEIRARVERFPYLTEERNDKVDVNKIPRLNKRSS
jgi:glycine cleavage system aminomethyltransferase T